MPAAAIALCCCASCSHIFNSEYGSAPLDYAPGYENSLQGSTSFREYDDDLIENLLLRYGLHGRTIIEIGCGRGQFLSALCERGNNSGVGFDPSYAADGEALSGNPNVVIHAEAYGTRDHQIRADFICSRHTLEHIGSPRAFLASIRNATKGAGVPIFFEVPNGLFTLRDGGIWDIIYEHCSYFTPASLARLFRETGYEAVEVREAFAGQFLTMHAVTGESAGDREAPAMGESRRLITEFAETYQAKLRDWSSRLARLESEGKRVVIWGAGAKATTFLNLLRPASVEYVIDVNSRKHGKYVSGTGQKIVPPESLLEYAADEIICMNPNYAAEIRRQAHSLGSRANLIAA
jgi:SAM-dependent methyltransferase